MRIGTAGWAIPREHAAPFPAEGAGLARYAQVFDAVEINSSFHRRHKPETWVRWAATVPARFRFAVKLPKTITHVRKLAGAREELEIFLADVAGLGEKLGPLLVQLPPALAFEARRARTFFALLRSLHGGEVACEPRHASWFEPAADELLRAAGIARVAADPPRAVGGDRPGGDTAFAYLRLHGSPTVYRSAYGGERLGALAARLRALPNAARSWVMFDNTASGAATADALALISLTSAD